MQTIVDSVIYRIDKKRVDELYTAIPKVKTVFEDLNAILLNKTLEKENIDLIKIFLLKQYLSTDDLKEIWHLHLKTIYHSKDIASLFWVSRPQSTKAEIP